MIFSSSHIASDDLIGMLDLGTSKFTCLIAHKRGDLDGAGLPGADLQIIGFAVGAAGGFKGGVLSDMDGAEAAVRSVVSRAETMAGAKISDLIVGVSCGRLKSQNFSTTVDLKGSAVHQRHITELFSGGRDYAASGGRALLHLLPTGFTLDGATNVKDPGGMVGESLSLDLHAITADVGPLRNIALLLDRCHLKIRRLIASPYASALAIIRPEEMELGAMILDLGGGTTKLSLYVGGYFVHSDTIAMGGDLLTYGLAQNFSMPLRDAERVKILHGSLFLNASDARQLISHPVAGQAMKTEDQLMKGQISNVLREKTFHILNTVNQRLIESGFAPYAGQCLILTGGGAEMNGLCEFASEIFKRPARIGLPKVIAGSPKEAYSPAFSTSLGLYQAFSAYDGINVGLNHSLKIYGSERITRIKNWLKQSF